MRVSSAASVVGDPVVAEILVGTKFHLVAEIFACVALECATVATTTDIYGTLADADSTGKCSNLGTNQNGRQKLSVSYGNDPQW